MDISAFNDKLVFKGRVLHLRILPSEQNIPQKLLGECTYTIHADYSAIHFAVQPISFQVSRSVCEIDSKGLHQLERLGVVHE